MAAGVATDGGAPVVDGEFLLLEAMAVGVTEPETKASKMTLRTK